MTTRRGRWARRDERGAATVLVLAVAGLLVVVGAAVAGVAGIVAAHRSAQSAADLAALAGAVAVGRGEDGCGAAAASTARHGARLASCTTIGLEVRVAVEVPAPASLGLDVALRGEARAGPDPPPSTPW